MTYYCLGILLFGKSAHAVGSILDALVTCLDLQIQRVQKESVNNASATTFNIDYACRIGIGSLGANKNAQMASLPFYQRST